MSNRNPRARMKWRTMDLHLHTPASSDYQQREISYLDLLKQAEVRRLDMIAFTDHNTVAGYRRMMEEIQQLEILEGLSRLLPEEKEKLDEYRRLLDKILVLPGFEFTATLGFHILAIFPPDKSVREIEHLLLDLNIPSEKLEEGSATVGATSDVITAYSLINRAGGLVIAAHANSTNGVAMRGFGFGGQTKIAYTQDPNLHALEVTDLTHRGRRTTKAFFSGTKPEYPRRMHCIQGSDAHRLTQDKSRSKNLGIGDRATEVLLPEVSFKALLDLFSGEDFARTRPHRQKEEPEFDFILGAREEGSNIVQEFHESMTVRGGRLYSLIADVCAFANTNGGVLFVGLSGDANKAVVGVPKPNQAKETLEREISNRISPALDFTVDTNETRGKKILRVIVPRGADPPYVVDDYKIYVRAEAETSLAVRDEIVDLVQQGRREPVAAETHPAPGGADPMAQAAPGQDGAPRTGVEIVSVTERRGTKYYAMRDLRNGNVVNNVTRKSARKLWHYAIKSHEELPKNMGEANVQWQGDLGILRRYKQGKSDRFDLVEKAGADYRIYFGVTDEGVHGGWKTLVGADEDD
ncbi:MAG: putative DNA binding domain-containing protein [Anaerolineales bacterium]|nr:putative DNA binding domain-containing protein [Anaerolineales bacterium]